MAGIKNIIKVEYRLNKACDFNDLIENKGLFEKKSPYLKVID